MAAQFDISPQKEGSFLQFLYRQFFLTPSPISSERINLNGQTAVVTGSNGGIGLEVCKQLLHLGLTKLIIAVRDESKGKAAAASLSTSSQQAAIEVWPLDLSSYDSIINFTERMRTPERLDIIILNAGITRQVFQLSPSTGHEENIQINYLSMVLLTMKLLPVVDTKKTAQGQPSRIVIVSSDAASWSKFPERNSDPLLPVFDKKGTFDMIDRYYTSKLLQQFFLQEVAKRVPSTVATIVATTPGLVYGTEALRDSGGTFKGFFNDVAKRIIGYSPEVGARQLTDAATRDGSGIHGHFLCSQKVKP
jgi:NAD(P)-dependent dehydrogenase (short-subunit alcohol dehydrogenase family)